MDSNKKKSISIGVCGLDSSHHHFVKTIDLQDIQIIVVEDEKEDPYIFEVNGLKYRPVETPQRNNYGFSKYMAEMILLSSSMGMGHSLKGPKPNVNIISEFRLIQNKQSRLSRSQRDYVVNQFNKLFERVKLIEEEKPPIW